MSEPQSARAKDNQRLLGLIKHSWLESGDVMFKRHLHAQQGVTTHPFVQAVDEYANDLLADRDVDTPTLGYLLIAGMAGSRVKSEDWSYPAGAIIHLESSARLPNAYSNP
ncbi:ISPsy26, transposase orfB [Pseudomonas fluorescens]|uniref:ISPsy26, transposase orfB n=1 Tax=Pseudomonas fluorescens TaxID=294 RepID=A0A379IDI9_PSEFL|nr:ISPsy26, transposase orfB [Pseudomonas fluorescens]